MAVKDNLISCTAKRYMQRRSVCVCVCVCCLNKGLSNKDGKQNNKKKKEENAHIHTLNDSHLVHVPLWYWQLGLVPINKALEQARGPGSHAVLPGAWSILRWVCSPAEPAAGALRGGLNSSGLPPAMTLSKREPLLSTQTQRASGWTRTNWKFHFMRQQFGERKAAAAQSYQWSQFSDDSYS